MAFRTAGNKVEVAEAQPGHLEVRGWLTFATARTAYDAGLRAIRKSNGALTIDCAGITASDSAGLAVLIEWVAAAGRAGRTVTFANVPPGIRAAAEISDVSAIVGFAPA